MHQHGIHRALDIGDQARGRDQGRVHAQLDAFAGGSRRAAGDAQQLDAVAQLFGVADVHCLQLADAFHVGLVELHRDAEGNRRHDGQLVRGIHAFDVEGRIGLGVAQRLRLRQHGGEVQSLVAHLGQNEVGGAVDDAGHRFDAVGGQAFAQRLDDRDAAGHGRLERDDHALLLRGGENLVAVQRHQRLVGGDDMLAVGNGLQHQFARQLVATDQLDNDVDVGMVHHGERVVDDLHALAGDRACALGIARGDHRHFDATAGAAADIFLVALEYVKGAGTNGADAQQANLNRFHKICFS